MFIDASGIVAILNEEAGYEELVKRIEGGDAVRFVYLQSGLKQQLV